jgi:hypothetical protein
VPFTPPDRPFAAISEAQADRPLQCLHGLKFTLETIMKALNYFAALSLSLVLGLMPFAVIAVNDLAAAKPVVSNLYTPNPVHALGMEGR